jgi:hypothetical protein
MGMSTTVEVETDLMREFRQRCLDTIDQHFGKLPEPSKPVSGNVVAATDDEEWGPSFSFDKLNILGADSEGLVYLQASYYVPSDDADPFKPCIIITTRTAFKKALGYWLDDKVHHCETRWEGDGFGFFGVMGSLEAHTYMELPEEERYGLMPACYERDADPDEGEKWIPKPVRTFYVKSFAKGCNMERG